MQEEQLILLMCLQSPFKYISHQKQKCLFRCRTEQYCAVGQLHLHEFMQANPSDMFCLHHASPLC